MLDLESGTQDQEGPSIGVQDGEQQCGALKVEDGCAGEVFEGEAVPLDLQIIFDQSGSMATVIDETTGQTRMDSVHEAVASFLNDPESSGLGVGISYFGYQPIGATSCDPEDYSDAAVSIGPLPGNAQSVLSSLSGVAPTGETPTGSAIRGGCSITSAYKSDHRDRIVVNLLVTDGEPKAPVTSKSTDCSPTLDDAVNAAEQCYDGGAGTATYVLGVGPSLDNLNEIASAGGTERAYLVADDSSQGVLDALNSVRIAAQVPCEIELPDDSSDTLFYEQTSVVAVDSNCTISHVSRVTGIDTCDAGNGGFYFDDAQSPRNIVLCEATCAAVRLPRAKLLYSIGCGLEEVK